MAFIASFDIGVKNFACYVEEIDEQELLTLKNDCVHIKSSQRYLKDSKEPSDEFKPFLDRLYKSGKCRLLFNVDLSSSNVNKTKNDTLNDVLCNMTKFLDSHESIWMSCSHFVIEQQMNFGRQTNKVALKLSHHCQSYFLIKHQIHSVIIEFPAYNKTKVLGASKKDSCTKPQRKKWCIEKGLYIMADIRNDLETVNQIKTSKKKDDLCDVICQLQAYKFNEFVNM